MDSAKVIVAINGITFPPYTCIIDFTKNPGAIDLTSKKPDGQDATLPGVLLFVDDNTIKWQIFPNGNRPADYDEKDSNGPIIVLKRIKN